MAWDNNKFCGSWLLRASLAMKLCTCFCWDNWRHTIHWTNTWISYMLYWRVFDLSYTCHVEDRAKCHALAGNVNGIWLYPSHVIIMCIKFKVCPVISSLPATLGAIFTILTPRPFSPFMPWSPAAPFGPAGPVSPWSPLGPALPGKPWHTVRRRGGQESLDHPHLWLY